VTIRQIVEGDRADWVRRRKALWRGIKTAIVSNTPWGSPADACRAELTRHGLLDKVDAMVFSWMSGGANLIAHRLIELYRCFEWRPPIRSS
jgi:hypothetical protein